MNASPRHGIDDAASVLDAVSLIFAGRRDALAISERQAAGLRHLLSEMADILEDVSDTVAEQERLDAAERAEREKFGKIEYRRGRKEGRKDLINDMENSSVKEFLSAMENIGNGGSQ